MYTEPLLTPVPIQAPKTLLNEANDENPEDDKFLQLEAKRTNLSRLLDDITIPTVKNMRIGGVISRFYGPQFRLSSGTVSDNVQSSVRTETILCGTVVLSPMCQKKLTSSFSTVLTRLGPVYSISLLRTLLMQQ